jgi:hypothetical protein
VASGANTTTDEAQVVKLVQEAVDFHSKLPSFTPTLASLSTAEGVYVAQGSSLSFKCDPEKSEALAQSPKPCWLGDLAAKRVVVLIGDSNAGSWEPVLGLALKQLNYKLAVFVYTGCTSQLINEPSAPIAAGENWRWCNLYHSKVVSVIEALHPKAIISAQLGEGSSGKVASFLPFAENWKKTFDRLTSNSPKTIRILMGTTPNNEAGSIPICLSRYLSSSTNAGMAICSPHYYPGANFSTNPWSYWQRDQLSASISNAKLIRTNRWFCGFQSTVEDYCPAVISNKLVYVDTDHISIAYMDTLDNVVRNSLVATGL